VSEGKAPRRNVATAGEPHSELARLTRAWRMRLDPDGIPLVRNRSRTGRVTQEEIAQLAGISSVWYAKLERGEPANYSEDVLDRLSSTLRLGDGERHTLFLLATGHEPPPRSQGRVSTVPLSNGFVRMVHDETRWPVYVSDQAWDVVLSNAMMRRWFPWVVEGHERNIMRWVFLAPEARIQLLNWETDWAPLMLAQMFYAHARRRDEPRLGSLIREILARNAFARNLWENRPAVYAHPDGDRRTVCLPHLGRVVEVEIVALEPMRATGVRVMHLVPVATDAAAPSD
jgi:transcriptional regulator with XRE-family HTH domain